ncbi:hypothetical protein ARNL5_02046, partial [Anaerolineae bacterium]
LPRDAAVEESDAADAAGIAVDPDLGHAFGRRARPHFRGHAVGFAHAPLRHPGHHLARLHRDRPLGLERRRILRSAVVRVEFDARAFHVLRARRLLVGRATLGVDTLEHLRFQRPGEDSGDGGSDNAGDHLRIIAPAPGPCPRRGMMIFRHRATHADATFLRRAPARSDRQAALAAVVPPVVLRGVIVPHRAIATDPSAALRDDAAQAIAQAVLEGFDKHYALFRECARAAKRHFEAAHFLAIGHVARDRIDFYDRRAAETAERIRREFRSDGVEGGAAEALWARVKQQYVAKLAEHRQPECAETFFNTVSCKLLHRNYFHNRALFVRPAVATEYLDADLPAYRSYYPRERGLRAAVINLILDFRLERRFGDFRRDFANVLRAFRARLPRPL